MFNVFHHQHLDDWINIGSVHVLIHSLFKQNWPEYENRRATEKGYPIGFQNVVLRCYRNIFLLIKIIYTRYHGPTIGSVYTQTHLHVNHNLKSMNEFNQFSDDVRMNNARSDIQIYIVPLLSVASMNENNNSK